MPVPSTGTHKKVPVPVPVPVNLYRHLEVPVTGTYPKVPVPVPVTGTKNFLVPPWCMGAGAPWRMGAGAGRFGVWVELKNFKITAGR